MGLDASTKTFVMFADILGFGGLTKKYKNEPFFGIDIADLIRPPKAGEDGHFRRAKFSAKEWFLGFHKAVTQMTLRHRTNLGRHSIVSFSDSVFVAGDGSGISRLAMGLMRLCILQHIPIRIGIGYGYWTELQFVSSVSPGRHYYAAQFLGTGVTNAYLSETKGGKGLRIFVHVSAAQRLDPSEVLVPLPDSEKNPNASHELDYTRKESGANTVQSPIMRCIGRMETRTRGAHRIHYSATWSAIERMNPGLSLRVPAASDVGSTPQGA